MSIAELYNIYTKYGSICTDTRLLKECDIFFALKGPNFNGNTLALQALSLGASYVVVDEAIPSNEERIIRVNDVLQTLQQLARHHRERLKIPFLAITGSNGKTTTKELVYAVLSTTYKTYATVGNLNNHIGVPLTILKIRADAEIAIIEMGANHIGEIASYCTIALPTHGLITNCGKAHLEGFGSIEGVKKGKGELFDHLRANNGSAFINADDGVIKELSKSIKNIISYGTQNADTIGNVISHESFLALEVTHETGSYRINTNLVGSYNLSNVLAAVCIGSYFKVPFEKIKHAIESYSPSNNRSQLVTKGTNRIILDAYNANPSSMKAAIENFAAMSGNNKVLILGSMAEMGSESRIEHQEIIEIISKYKWQSVLLVGKEFNSISHQYISMLNAGEVKEWINKNRIANAEILIKGSRTMGMEKVLE